MPYSFTDPSGYAYKPGCLYLGIDPARGREIGVDTERHAITIAGAGGGKGQALILQNLARWPHAALVVDPKGENAEETYEARERMGQIVGVLDPFKVANVPDRLRKSFNPLAGIDPNGLTAREDVLVIADGVLKRSGSSDDSSWEDGAMAIIAGVIAFVIGDAPREHRTLTAARRILLQEKKDLYEDAQRMLDCDACGGLARAAAVTIMTALDAEKGSDKEYLAGARRQSAWLDSPAVAASLASSSFELDALAQDNATLFLVLP